MIFLVMRSWFLYILGLLGIFVGPTTISALVPVIITQSHSLETLPSAAFFTLIIICLVLTLLIIGSFLFLPSSYTIDENKIIQRIGPYRAEILLKDIRRLRRGSRFISFPGDRIIVEIERISKIKKLKLRRKHNLSIFLSSSDVEKIINLLTRYCPDIEILNCKKIGRTKNGCY